MDPFDTVSRVAVWENLRSNAIANVGDDPGLPARLSGYSQQYWWMAPDATWSMAKAGIDPNDPTARAAATSAAGVASNQGLGFHPIGSPATVSPGAPVDLSGVSAELGLGNNRPDRSSISSERVGLGSTFQSDVSAYRAQQSPVQQLAGDDWYKLDPAIRTQLAGLSFANADPSALPAWKGFAEGHGPTDAATLAGQPVIQQTIPNLDPSSQDLYEVQGIDSLDPQAHKALQDILSASGHGTRYFGPAFNAPVVSGQPVAQNLISVDKNLTNHAQEGNPFDIIVQGLPQLGRPLQAAAIAAQAPYQEVQGLVRDLHQITSKHERPNFESQSDLGIIAGDWLSGNQVDIGDSVMGASPGSGVEQERQRRIAERGLIQGHGVTIGRWLANSLPDSINGLHVMDPNSNAYNAVSGAADAAAALYLDPVARGLKSLGEYREASRLFSESPVQTALREYHETGQLGPAIDRVQEAGGLSGLQPTVSLGARDAWLTADRQANYRRFLTETDDPATVWALHDRQIDPGAAYRIAKSQDEPVILDELRGQLGGNVRTQPKLSNLGSFGLNTPIPSLEDATANLPTSLVSRPPSRWTAMMPKDRVAGDDLQANALQVERIAALTKADPAQYRDWFSQMAQTTDRFERQQVYENILGDVEDTLVPKVGAERAMNLTRMYQSKLRANSVYADASIAEGGGMFTNGVTGPDGVMHVIDDNPHNLAQTLNGNIPMPDWREIRTALSPYRAVIENPVVAMPYHLADWVTNKVWRALQTMTAKTGFKVVADGMAAMAGRGYDTIFRHPLDGLSAIMASPLAEVPADERFLQRIEDATKGKVAWASVPGAAVNSLRYDPKAGLRWIVEHIPGVEAGGTFRANSLGEDLNNQWWLQSHMNQGVDTLGDRAGAISAQDWQNITKPAADSPMVNEYYRSWGRVLAQYASAPDSRGVALADSLDDAKAWYWEGEGAPLRKILAKAGPEYDVLRTKAGSDQWVENETAHLQAVTNGNPELMDAIRTSKLGNASMVAQGIDGTPKTTDEFIRQLPNYYDDAPIVTRQQKALYSGILAKKEMADQFVHEIFHALMSGPSATVVISPLGRQAYWQRAIEVAPFMTADGQAELLRVAENEANIGPRALGELQDAIAAGNRNPGDYAGTITLAQQDKISQAHAVDMIQATAHDFSERSQMMDMLRVLSPFGEVWRKTIKRWASIANQNPAVLRRFQQGYEALQSPQLGGLAGQPAGQGFFHKDAYGQMVFTVPFSQAVDQALTGVPVPLVGNVAGLSMGTDIMPGLGPVAQIPAAWTLDQLHAPQSVRDAIFPHGAPSNFGDVWAYAPAWMRRGLGQDRPSDPDAMRTFNYSVIDVLRYGLSDGTYDLSTPASVQKSIEDATSKAQHLNDIRGIAQFFVPGAPAPELLLHDKTGKLVDASIVIGDYQKMIDDPNIGPQNAGRAFLDKYGPNVFQVATAKSFANALHLPTTADSAQWVADNPDVKRDGPHVYGFFAPPSDPNQFDYQTYLDQLHSGERTPLTPEEWVHAANGRLAAIQYAHARDRIDALSNGKPNTDQRAWLATVKQNLMDEYPGYREALYGGSGLPQRTGSQVLVAEAQKLVDNPAVAATDAGQGLASYLRLRAKADSSWTGSGNKPLSWLQSNSASAVNLRTWLRNAAALVEQDHPQFGPMFEDVFSWEMRDDTNPAALTGATA